MPTTPPPRAATLATAGGALWVLLPVAWGAVSLEDAEPGTAGFLAVATSYWLFAVLPPGLLVVGLVALRRALGDRTGRAGAVGIALAAVGLAGMALGNAIEVASMTAGGGEVALGHAMFLLGFLVSVLGSLLLGVVVFRRRRDALSRAAGLVMACALPLGVGLGILGASIDPGNDAWFFAAITVPTGVAWVLLGRSLASAPRAASRQLSTAA